MNIVGETFLRHCLKPRVECDLPGRLRMRFRHSEQLSKGGTALICIMFRMF